MRTKNVLCIITAVIAIFTLSTCDFDNLFSNGNQNTNYDNIIVEPTKGKFTVTKLENFNNCYVVAFGWNWNYESLYAAENVDNRLVFTGGKVANGKVSLNVWKDDRHGTLKDYDDTGDFGFLVYVLNKTDFTKAEELVIGGYLYQHKPKPTWLKEVGRVYGSTVIGGTCEAEFKKMNPL